MATDHPNFPVGNVQNYIVGNNEEYQGSTDKCPKVMESVWGVIKVLVKYRRVLEDNWKVSGSNDNCQVDNGYCHWSTKQSGMLNITKIKVILIF